MAELAASVCNPLLRTPLSLIVDDSCAVVNLTHFWIRQPPNGGDSRTPDIRP